MRLLHVYAGPYPTIQGTQVLVGQTASLLALQGHDVHLLCYSHGGAKPDAPFSIHRIPDLPRFKSERSRPHYKKLALDVSLTIKTANLIKTLDPDIVHAHHYEALVACILADPKRKKPRAFHAHALFAPELPTYVRGLLRPFFALTGRVIDKHLPQFADGIIAITPEMKRALEADLKTDIPIVLARPPFEAAPQEVSWAPLPEKTGTSIIYVGNLDEYQGMGNLLKGLLNLDSATLGALKIDILTDSDTAQLRQDIRATNLTETIRITPHGTWSDIFARLKAADFMVVPRTLTNGFPIKIVNALAAGCPILADYRVSEELRHEEEIYKVDMKNPEGVAMGISRLAKDSALREKLRQGGADAALRLHDPQKTASAIETFYMQILKRSSRNLAQD